MRLGMNCAVGLSVLLLTTAAATVYAQDDSEGRIQARIEQLASEDLGGRAPGSSGIETARSLVRGWLEESGFSFESKGPESNESVNQPTVWSQAFQIADLGMKSLPRAEEVHLNADATWPDVELANLVALLPGNAANAKAANAKAANAKAANEVILVGAHLDHLGRDSDGRVFGGADDNASGVAALVEVASLLVEEGPFQRDLAFVFFDGEEAGQLGAKYLAKNPQGLGKVVTMISLDAIGRMAERRLYALGTESGQGLAEALRGINLGYGFDLAQPVSGPFASDHVPFHESGVPALHFTTGANPDYHRPSDTADKIAAAELAEVAEFVAEFVGYLADEPEAVTFVPPGAASVKPPATAGSGSPRRVSLGTIPDFSRTSGGVLLSGVMPGSPAAEAGLEKGDVLKQIGGVPVEDLAAFSQVLKSHAPGDVVEVVFERAGETLSKEVTLAERSR